MALHLKGVLTMSQWFLSRDYDMHLELQMAGITYVHTQRFLSNILTFFTNFQQLQDTINKAQTRNTGTNRFRSIGFKPPAFGTARASR